MKFGAIGLSIIAVGVALGGGKGGGAWAGPADTLLEAKRKAAADLVREKKWNEGIELMKEVVRLDGGRFQDHLLLARAYDVTNKALEAAGEYRLVLSLAPSHPSTAEEKSARAEAERRIKVLDPQSEKVDAAMNDFLTKLATLEREAVRWKNAAAQERIFRLRVAVYRGAGRDDMGGVEVDAAITTWQQTGFTVRRGEQYHVLAQGTWQYEKGRGGECDADGFVDRPLAEGARLGSLIGTIGADVTHFFPLGRDYTFTAKADGELLLSIHDYSKGDNSGRIKVLLERAGR